MVDTDLNLAEPVGPAGSYGGDPGGDRRGGAGHPRRRQRRVYSLARVEDGVLWSAHAEGVTATEVAAGTAAAAQCIERGDVLLAVWRRGGIALRGS